MASALITATTTASSLPAIPGVATVASASLSRSLLIRAGGALAASAAAASCASNFDFDASQDATRCVNRINAEQTSANVSSASTAALSLRGGGKKVDDDDDDDGSVKIPLIGVTMTAEARATLAMALAMATHYGK